MRSAAWFSLFSARDRRLSRRPSFGGGSDSRLCFRRVFFLAEFFRLSPLSRRSRFLGCEVEKWKGRTESSRHIRSAASGGPHLPFQPTNHTACLPACLLFSSFLLRRPPPSSALFVSFLIQIKFPSWLNRGQSRTRQAGGVSRAVLFRQCRKSAKRCFMSPRSSRWWACARGCAGSGWQADQDPNQASRCNVACFCCCCDSRRADGHEKKMTA